MFCGFLNCLKFYFYSIFGWDIKLCLNLEINTYTSINFFLRVAFHPSWYRDTNYKFAEGYDHNKVCLVANIFPLFPRRSSVVVDVDVVVAVGVVVVVVAAVTVSGSAATEAEAAVDRSDQFSTLFLRLYLGVYVMHSSGSMPNIGLSRILVLVKSR